MDDTPYRPDLTPDDFRPFGYFKKYLPGKGFATDANVK
jgi:hypothetical protein